MINEVKILFNNIKNFRHLLTEGVSQDAIIKAIQNHEWIRLYYNADNEEGENATGYRIVRPYVLGTNKSGNAVLRAWQDNPRNSWHFDNRATRPDSNHHDVWSDSEGEKPGWRMFRVDRISSAYPIGKKFNDLNGLPMIPAGYHEGGDDNMTSIIAYVSTKTEPDFDMKYDKDVEVQAVTPNDVRAKWDSIRRGNKSTKKITPDDVVNLRNYASRVLKKSHANFLVAIDDQKNFQLITPNDKRRENIPDYAIVGSLPYLYDSMIKQNAPADAKFFNDVKNKTQNDLKTKTQEVPNEPQKSGMDFGSMGMMKETKKTKTPEIPYKKMTFFK